MAEIDNIVYEARFTWDDAAGCMGAYQSLFESLPSDKQEELKERFAYSLAKSMEAGIMHEWWVIMSAAVEHSGILEEIDRLSKGGEDSD